MRVVLRLIKHIQGMTSPHHHVQCQDWHLITSDNTDFPIIKRPPTSCSGYTYYSSQNNNAKIFVT